MAGRRVIPWINIMVVKRQARDSGDALLYLRCSLMQSASSQIVDLMRMIRDEA